MKIIYSLPHPADQLDSGQAGHTVRAQALLTAIESLGHEIVRVQAASGQGSQTAVNTYRQVVKKLIPRPLAMWLRDRARVAYSTRYARRLIDAIEHHQPDIILETHIAFSLAGKIASEHTGLPLVLDDVAPSWEEEQQYGVGAKKLARRTHREVTQHASLLVAVSGVIRQMLIAEGIPKNKVISLPNGINNAMLTLNLDGGKCRHAWNIPQDAIVIVFVGSFQPYHRVDWLLEAFAQLETSQKTHLLLVGDGQRAPEAKKLTAQLGLGSRVTFTGRVPYGEVDSYIAAGDIAIMPATNTYGNPMKLYEYMALGKAIIAPDQETITEIVTDRKTALLFEPENISAMADVMAAVISDPGLRERLGRHSLEEAREHTWIKRGSRLSAALERVLETHPSN